MARQKQPLDPEGNILQEEAITDNINTNTPPLPTDPQSINDYTQSILKTFPFYEYLYVDRDGGSYTPNTPLSIRKNATLYKNPYYKKS